MDAADVCDVGFSYMVDEPDGLVDRAKVRTLMAATLGDDVADGSDWD